MYERTRRNLNFQRRANNYAQFLVIYQRPRPFINAQGRNNRAADALVNRMAKYTNSRKGTRYYNGTRTKNALYPMMINYKSLLNNNAKMYRLAGQAVRHSPTRGYVWNHPGMAIQLQKVLNRVRRSGRRSDRIKKYTEALKYASNYEKAKKRWASVN